MRRITLSKDIYFPNPRYASAEGLLASGGDLSAERILFAYQNGIFPWYSEGEPVLWWSPDPRFVLFPKEIKISKSMKQVFKKQTFTLTFDKSFEQVIRNCASTPRKGQAGTWLVKEMIQAYIRLHELGFAHSVETWEGDKLVGGLYGLSLGKCFFGESMFSHQSNASKAALIFLAENLLKKGFELIDCQAETSHLATMGAKFIPRDEFLDFLDRNKDEPTLQGNWGRIEW